MKNLLILLAFAMSACAHSIHQVHTSDFSPGAAMSAGQMVQASAEQFVVLGFTSQTDYVNIAHQSLMNSCPNGSITGITTQLSTSLGFLSWTNKALMQGLCLK